MSAFAQSRVADATVAAPGDDIRVATGGRPLRVCHIAYTFYENDNRVIRYAEALAERGDLVEVIALRRPGQSTRGMVNGVRVHRIQRRSVNERGALAYLFKLVWFLVKSTAVVSVLQLRRRYDIVHVHNVPDFLVFAAILPKMMGTRVILDIHDILPELYSGKFGSEERSLTFAALLLTERLSCRFADHVIIANHLWYDKLIRRTLRASKCTAIINYPDLRLFAPYPGDRPADRPFTFLYPGTLNHHQGLDIAIDAFAAAAPQMPDAELHVYGEGPARRQLTRQAAELGLANRVKIMDRVPLQEVSRLMAGADIGVVPKRADGFGNEAFSTKILEFMACGVPAIVSRTQVDAHYFDASLVRFFQPGDAADLARAMVWAYEQRGAHGAWVERARAFAVRNSWQERAIDYLQIVERLSTAKQPSTVGL
jgi:glycosyltransferase involved in cell wall biosynthesis